MNYQEICKQAISLIRETGVFVREEKSRFKRGAIRYKHPNDLVSYVDIESEKRLKAGLLEILPGSSMLAEETEPEEKDLAQTWIVDPIDGTTNFVHGLNVYCISVALYVDAQARVGIVYDPEADECFHAWEGGGAWLNDEQIRVSDIETLKESLVATGFPYIDFSRLEPYMQVFDWCMKNTHGIRRLGSAALDLAYVACGRFETFFEYGLKPWDVAAGAFIVQQAGGVVTGFTGKSNFLLGQEIIATNGLTQEELLTVVKKHF